MGYITFGEICFELYSNQHESVHELYQMASETMSVVCINENLENTDHQLYTVDVC